MDRGPDANTTGGQGPRPDRSTRRRAGELSGHVLEILRQTTTALTPADVQHRLNAAGAEPLAYTTVVTVLSRLHDQGLAERFRTGRAYSYLAVADEALAAQRMRRALDDENDRDAVLANFVHDLSPEDERRLRALLGEPDTGLSTKHTDR